VRRRSTSDRSGDDRLSDQPNDGGDDWDDEWDDDWDGPNYLVRRAIVVAALVAVVALGAVLVGRLLGDDDSTEARRAVAVDWDTVLVLETDQVRLVDPDSGDKIDSYSSPIDLLDAQSVVANGYLIALSDSGRVVQTDLSDGSQARSRSSQDSVLLVTRDDPSIAVIGDEVGSDVTVIDTDNDTTFAIGDVAEIDDPLIFARDVIVNPAGTHLAVPVPNEFQSVVIDLVTKTSSPLAGRVIAIGDDRTVTEQPAGDQSEVEFVDLDGERLGSADVGTPVATLLRDDGRLLTIDSGGTVSILSDDGSVEDVDTLTADSGEPTSVTDGFVVADGTAVVVVTDRSVRLLDVDGAVIATATGSLSSPPTRGAACIVVRDAAEANTAVLDILTGETLAETAASFATASSYDGCTIAVGGAAPQLFVDGEFIEVESDSIVDVAPDGDGYVTLDDDVTWFVPISDEAFELADEPVVVRFADR
jgi:hypothetical protein